MLSIPIGILDILKFENRDQSSRPGAAQIDRFLQNSRNSAPFSLGFHAVFGPDFPNFKIHSFTKGILDILKSEDHAKSGFV